MDKLFNKVKSGLADRSQGSAGSSVAPIDEPVQQPWDALPSARQIYQYRRQRGVNLGSLFTLETWLTPSLFQGVKGAKSEQDLCKALDKGEVKKRLERHWSNFVDDGDFNWMSSNGINTIRLPISYYHWLAGHPDEGTRSLMNGTEYASYADIYTSAYGCIINIIEKARSHGIGVLIDLHGAPGGQNTEGHCGLSTNSAAFFEKSKHRANTIAILRSLVDALAQYENVVGIELLNEPQNHAKLPSFYNDAIQELALSRPEQARLPIYIGDCWSTDQYAGMLAEKQKHTDPRVLVAIDHHLYRCFTSQDHHKSAQQHADEVRPDGNGPSIGLLRRAAQQTRGNVVIGEWSAALNPSSLHGHGDHRSQQQAWATAQLNAYNDACAGFYFWTLKKEGPPDAGWCLYSAIEQGILPAGLGRPSPNLSPQQMQDLGQRNLQGRYDGHVAYWSQNANGGRMMHEKYRDGYSQAWRDAMAFLGFNPGRPSTSEVGFVGQWIAIKAHAYALQRCNGSRENEWEYVQGAEMAFGDFRKVLSGH